MTSPQTGRYVWNWLWYSQLGPSTISAWNLQRVDVSWSPVGVSCPWTSPTWFEVNSRSSSTGQVECDCSSEKHETQDILSNYLLLYIVSIFVAPKYPNMTLFEWLCSCKLLTTDDKLHPIRPIYSKLSRGHPRRWLSKGKSSPNCGPDPIETYKHEHKKENDSHRALAKGPAKIQVFYVEELSCGVWQSRYWLCLTVKGSDDDETHPQIANYTGKVFCFWNVVGCWTCLFNSHRKAAQLRPNWFPIPDSVTEALLRSDQNSKNHDESYKLFG